MSWNLTTSGAAIFKAGKYADANIILSGTALSKWSDMAEAVINSATRRDWVSLSGSTKTNFAGILDDTASSMIAMNIISYDMSTYPSRIMAQSILDYLHNGIVRNLEILKDEKNKEKIIT